MSPKQHNAGRVMWGIRGSDRVSYIGETSKPAYTRFKQHFANYRAASAANLPALPNPTLGGSVIRPRRDVKSWMWEHVRDMHGGVVGGMGDFKIKVTEKLRKCLERGFRYPCVKIKGELCWIQRTNTLCRRMLKLYSSNCKR